MNIGSLFEKLLKRRKDGETDERPAAEETSVAGERSAAGQNSSPVTDAPANWNKYDSTSVHSDVCWMLQRMDAFHRRFLCRFQSRWRTKRARRSACAYRPPAVCPCLPAGEHPPFQGSARLERNPYRGIRRIRRRVRQDQTSVYPGVMCHRPASHDPEMKTALPGGRRPLRK